MGRFPPVACAIVRLLAVVAAIACVVSLGVPAAGARAPSPVVAFLASTSLDPTPCPVPVPDGASVACGWLRVPESRQRPEGRTIRLMVAVVRNSAAPSRPPLLVTAGGPGTSSTGLLGLAGSAFSQDRDLVVLEQRGTRYSEPSLACPEVEDALVATLTTTDPVPEETGREVAAARTCADRLRGEGIDLTAYDTAENAADVADLRRALGYPEWDLWGLSYSTQLMLTVLRDHPEGVRSVVLDSVVPPEVAQYDVQVASFAEAHARLAADCAAVPACAEGYPDLGTALPAAAARLDAHPLEVTVASPRTGAPVRLRLTGDDLLTVVFEALYDPSTIRYVPLLVDRLGAGDVEAAVPVADAALEELSGRALGLYYSVQCAEKAPLTGPAAAARDAAALPGRERTHLLWLGSDLDVCRAWGVPPRPEAAVPVTSDVPVLVMAGRYDPVTPPAWARQVADRLPRSVYVEVPGQGHTPSVQGDCAPGIVLDFLADPRREPDLGCLGALPPPDVVLPSEVHPTGGVYRLAGEVEQGPGVRLVGLALALAGLLVGAAGVLWHLVGRRRLDPVRLPAGLVAAAALLDLAAVTALVLVVLDTAAEDLLMLGFGLPSVTAPLLVLPVAGGFLAVGALLLVAVRRWRGDRRPAATPSVVVGAASALGLIGVFAVLGLLP